MRSLSSFASTTCSGSVGVAVGQRVQQGDAVAAGVGDGPQLVESGDRRVRDRQQGVVELVDGQADLAGDLLVGRDPVELGLELGVGPLDLAGAGPNRSGNPVEGAQLVEDRAADTRDRVRLEADLTGQVESLDRVDQADEAVGDQVALLDMGRAGRSPCVRRRT